MKVGDTIHGTCFYYDIEGVVTGGQSLETGLWTALQGSEIDADSKVRIYDNGLENREVVINGWLWDFEVTKPNTIVLGSTKK